MDPTLQSVTGSPRSVLWRRLDQPGFDAATLVPVDEGWRLEGAAVFVETDQPCRLNYHVACDADWRTTRATITGRRGGELIDVVLTSDASRRWWFNGVECPQVHGCIDVDLSFTPATNLLPICRLGLSPGEHAAARAAWLSFPALILQPLRQVYRRLDERRYHYGASDFSFTTQIVVSATGFAISYPPLWQAEAET